jgi:hypothetical protein
VAARSNPGRRKNSGCGMEVFGILGNRGNFKTCFMVSRLYQDHLAGEKITANFTLKFPYQRRSFQQVRDELKKMEKSEGSDNPYIPSFRGHIMAFDELSTGADSYEFMLSHVRELTWFISQLRKLGCMTYYTDQRYGKVVKRIRDQTDAFWLMRDLDAGKMHYEDGTVAKRHRDVCAGNAEYLIVNSDLEPVGNAKPKPFNGKPWYEYYNTDEFVFDRHSA